MRRGPCLPFVALAFLLAASGDAHAAPAGGAAELEEARALMVDGNAQLHAGKAAEALDKLERSFALVPSPNTELLVARALRDLGRRVEAARRFEHAEAEARRRTLAGEVKYGQTEAAAHAEGGSLRAELGTLHVHVARPGNVALLVDGQPVPLTNGDASVLHEPGRAEIVLREDGAEQRQIVTVVAGTTLQTEFAGQGGRSEPPPRVLAPVPPPPRRSTWALPAALVSGGVTLLGAGTLTYFGLRSESTWSDLSSRCGPSFCGPADRSDADAAKTNQTIANVGLVVGAVAAVATITFVVMHLTARDDAAQAAAGL